MHHAGYAFASSLMSWISKGIVDIKGKRREEKELKKGQ